MTYVVNAKFNYNFGLKTASQCNFAQPMSFLFTQKSHMTKMSQICEELRALKGHKHTHSIISIIYKTIGLYAVCLSACPPAAIYSVCVCLPGYGDYRGGNHIGRDYRSRGLQRQGTTEAKTEQAVTL